MARSRRFCGGCGAYMGGDPWTGWSTPRVCDRCIQGGGWCVLVLFGVAAWVGLALAKALGDNWNW